MLRERCRRLIVVVGEVALARDGSSLVSRLALSVGSRSLSLSKFSSFSLFPLHQLSQPYSLTLIHRIQFQGFVGQFVGLGQAGGLVVEGVGVLHVHVRHVLGGQRSS